MAEGGDDPSQNSVSVTNTSEEVPGKREKFSKLGVFQEPLCLIKNEADGIFSIEEDVLNQISQIDRTVNVIAIAGPYRSGKSYLMNTLARNKHGFSLGNGVDAKTKGIWVWCLIHPVYTDQVMILLDTEGIGDAKKSNSDNDNKLLCITTLICSTFIYNIKGVINMETLDKLGFVTYCARKVSVSGDKQQNAYSSNIGLYFPDFVLTLRDFSHDLGKETPNAYLERMLTLKNDDEKENYNQIRACIRNFFQKRECFIFDTPVSGRKNLAKLECTDEKDLLKSFKEDSHIFIDSITKCKPKELLDGKNMNGSMFSSLVKAYVNMFNVDGIPCINSALTTMATHENMIVVKNVAESFRIELNKNKLPVYNEKKVLELYQRERKRVNEEFRSKCVLIIEEPVDNELKKHIDEIWKEYNDENIRIQKEECGSAMENMYGSEIKKKMNEGIYGDEGGYSKYAKDLDHIKSQTRQNFRDMDDTLFNTIQK